MGFYPENGICILIGILISAASAASTEAMSTDSGNRYLGR